MYYEVDYIPHGWDIEVAARFSDQVAAFRYAHLLALVTGHVAFLTAYVSKNGRFVSDMKWVSERANDSMHVTTSVWDFEKLLGQS